MNLKSLLTQLSSDSQGREVSVALNDFFRSRVCTFQVTPKEVIRDRIDSLRGQVPEEVSDVFFEIDEAYGDLMAAQNIEIYKRGFSECLQLILSVSDNQILGDLK